MNLLGVNTQGRVRKSSSEKANKEIDQKTLQNIKTYNSLTKEKITQRLKELDKEWDIEKTLEVNASALALTGLLLGTYVNKKWYILPGVVTAFLLQHGLQGWCPPLPLFRKLGIRTRQEIDEERYSLKILRGDFDKINTNSKPVDIVKTLRS
jgi:predicted DNA-binding transcriptional regulator